ncbi:hypothetical protein [Cryptosporangium sp. NPDC048952]|uniref:hypothetical protein n=1 Tax=Cryptosporangium sp. NPDC048952 TaxID=3363961 RepID=UPI0037236C85
MWHLAAIWALNGTIVDTDWTVVSALIGVPAGLAGLVGVAFDLGDRRVPRRSLPVPDSPVEPELPPLTEPSFDEFGPYVARQVRPYAWLSPRRARGVLLRPSGWEVLDRLKAPGFLAAFVTGILRPSEVTGIRALRWIPPARSGSAPTRAYSRSSTTPRSRCWPPGR